MVPGWWRPLDVGLQPVEHFAACGLESDHLPGFVEVGKGFDEGPELVGVHGVDRQVFIHDHAPDEGGAMHILEVGVKDFFHILAQLLIDQSGLAGLDRRPDFFDIAAHIIGGIHIFASVEAHMGLDHGFSKLPAVHVVDTIERIGRALVLRVKLVGNGNGVNLLFHVEHFLS